MNCSNDSKEAGRPGSPLEGVVVVAASIDSIGEHSKDSLKRAREEDTPSASPLTLAASSGSEASESNKRARTDEAYDDVDDEDAAAAVRSLATPKPLILPPAPRNGWGSPVQRDDNLSPAIQIVGVASGRRDICTFERDESPLRGDCGSPYRREPYNRFAHPIASSGSRGRGRVRGAPAYAQQERRPPQPLHYHEPSYATQWPATAACLHRDAYMLRYPDHARAFASAAAPAVGAPSPDPATANLPARPANGQGDGTRGAHDTWRSCASGQRRRSRSPPRRHDRSQGNERGRYSNGRRDDERHHSTERARRGRSTYRDWDSERGGHARHGNGGYHHNDRHHSGHRQSDLQYRQHRRQRHVSPSPLSRQVSTSYAAPASFVVAATATKSEEVTERKADHRSVASLKQRQRYHSPPRHPDDVLLKEEGEIVEGDSSDGLFDSDAPATSEENATVASAQAKNNRAAGTVADIHLADLVVAPAADGIDSLKDYEEYEHDELSIPVAL